MSAALAAAPRAAAARDPGLLFVVPLRHPANARSWAEELAKLRETLLSIAAQTHGDWRAVVVANAGAALPALPPGVEVERVEFSPNPLHARGEAPDDEFYEAVRWDKGRRVLAGLLRHRNARFSMVVDGDDLVSRRLAAFVAAHPDHHGWTIAEGFVWNDGGRLMYRHGDFASLCGTSHIVRTALLDLPDDAAHAEARLITRWLGSHRFLAADLAARGQALAVLPFAGAVYRVGHAGAHSGSAPVIRNLVMNASLLRRPHLVPGRVARLRWLTAARRREFFGDPAGDAS